MHPNRMAGGPPSMGVLPQQQFGPPAAVPGYPPPVGNPYGPGTAPGQSTPMDQTTGKPLTMIAPSTAFSGEAGRYPWYRVSFAGGVDLRHGPSIEAPRTGETLCQNATIAAAEELLGADGRVYLRLADGRGWAFDDYALFPHDPSVVRGYWQPVSLVPPGGQGQAGAAPAAGSPMSAGTGTGMMMDTVPASNPWG
eukprot:TRINITY_DN57996_c0_g1_i1.p1 TRINITY_DN57996_c0_g1~~TRINITY_DN57996_c0_g1_i1.p1  ORF type:complete len:195 (-),score=29.86 TRINITY_DN57996_c0_g1_i1:111-695(-)